MSTLAQTPHEISLVPSPGDRGCGAGAAGAGGADRALGQRGVGARHRGRGHHGARGRRGHVRALLLRPVHHQDQAALASPCPHFR